MDIFVTLLLYCILLSWAVRLIGRRYFLKQVQKTMDFILLHGSQDDWFFVENIVKSGCDPDTVRIALFHLYWEKLLYIRIAPNVWLHEFEHPLQADDFAFKVRTEVHAMDWNTGYIQA